MKKLLVFLVLIAAGVTAAAYYFHPDRQRRVINPDDFKTEKFKVGELTELISCSGVLQPRHLYAVSSELAGKVVELDPGLDVNRRVTKGDTLLRLDDTLLKIKRDQAEAAIKVAQSALKQAEKAREATEFTYNRLNNLVTGSAIGGKEEVDAAFKALKATEGGIAVAQAKIAEAKTAREAADIALQYVLVKSPATGIIIDKKVYLGQMVGPTLTTPLFTISSDFSTLQLHAQVAEADRGKVQAGMSVTFTLNAYTENNEEFKGKVEEIRPPSSTQGAVFYDAVVTVDNRRRSGDDWMLQPGMTANVQIKRREHKGVWLMPNDALNELDEQFCDAEAWKRHKEWVDLKDNDKNKSLEDWKEVWILQHGKPYPVRVKVYGKGKDGETGINDGKWTEVLEWEEGFRNPADKTAPADSQSPPVAITAPPQPAKGGWLDKLNNIKAP